MASRRRSMRQQLFNRRDALKVLAAIGGAAAASTLLPEKWIQPVVEAGVLPTHAQSTLLCEPPYAIDRCQVYDIYRETFTYLHYVSTAYLKPACAGIPLKFVHEILDENMEILYSFESSVVQETNFRGEVMMIFSTAIGFERVAHWVSVTWKIVKPEYGTSICTATEPIPQ